MAEVDAAATAALAQQFDDIEQQQEVASLGMWVFLATEIMFFGGVFLAYAVYRHFYYAGFGDGSRHLDVSLGSLNTVVLIVSSLTMALAVRSAQTGNKKGLMRFLVLTMSFGTVFLIIKFTEYYHKYTEHLIPGHGFSFEGPHSKQAELFMTFYFVMTSIHALHMIIGIGLLLVMLWMASRDKFSPAYYSPIEVSGLYWHFVDIVWIFLFPILYLVNRHH